MKVVEGTRLFGNLLSSQPLCFSLFSDLAEDLGLASKVIGTLLGKEVQVTRVEFEYSPGRGSPEYTADGTAADVYVEYAQGDRRGFLCIEVKYHEDLAPEPWTSTYRPRYSEVAQLMGCFRPGSEAVLQQLPLEQLWRDHLLAGAILHHPRSNFDEGAFVLLHPEINEACKDADTRLISRASPTSWSSPPSAGTKGWIFSAWRAAMMGTGSPSSS